MESEGGSRLLDALSAKVEARWDGVDPARRSFLEGLRHLQRGELEEASRVFRRVARTGEAPFDTMAQMAHGRCEVVRGRVGVALRIFRSVTGSEAPQQLKRLAWMEMADLARQRDDAQLLAQARRGMQLTAS